VYPNDVLGVSDFTTSERFIQSKLESEGSSTWPGNPSKKEHFGKLLVRKGGLEPPRLAAPDPKSGASANSATFARGEQFVL
jgi:hypothetical protein